MTGGAVAAEAHTPDMDDTTQQPEPTTAEPVIESDVERELRAELAAAERRLVEQGETIAKHEAVERAQAGTELVAVGELPGDSRWHVMRQIAHELAMATVIPRGLQAGPERTEANVLTVLLKGYEIGLGPTTALDMINIIEGKPSLSGPGMAALITGRGHMLEFEDEYDDESKIRAVRCTGRRRDTGAALALSFSVADAVAAGLCEVDRSTPNGVRARGKEGGKKPWETYTPDMLRWRALSRVARMLFGDVLGGIGYTPEELQPDTIDVDSVTVNGRPQAATAPPVNPLTAEQSAELNRRVQSMTPDDRAKFARLMKAGYESGELPARDQLTADDFPKVQVLLEQCEVADAELVPDESDEGLPPDPEFHDDNSEITALTEDATPAPRWCIEIAAHGAPEPSDVIVTFTNDDVAQGDVVTIEGEQWDVRSVVAFDQRPM